MSTRNTLKRFSCAITALILATSPSFAQVEDDDEPVEEIVVEGVRSALEQALDIKRSNDAIVDAITAADIGALPALDIGESLQVIPGVQVNREKDDGSRRQSEISLRGLPGSFTLVTANGLTFASPSLSVQPQNGETNSFGSFDSGIFDGVIIYKSQQADMIEGGIAGTVDKRLAQALSKKDGNFFVRAEARYEELNENTDPGFVAGGTKHFIEDVFGGTFRLAWSEQDFRRDAVNITRYFPLNSGRFPGLDAWKAANGIAPEEAVLFASDIRQFSDVASGDRLSFAGGLEFAPSDALKLGVDALYTKRDLSEGSTEIFSIITRGGGTTVTPTSTPFAAFVDSETGETTYAVSDYDYVNPIFSEGNRVHDLTEEAQGLFFNLEYTTGDWLIESKASISDASVNRYGKVLQMQTRQIGPGNGITGSVSSGAGDIGNFVLTAEGGQLASYDQPFTESSTPYDDTFVSNADNSARFSATGNEIWRDRKEHSLQFDVTYDLDVSIIESLKFGSRYSKNETVANLFFISSAGLNWPAFSSDLIQPVEFASGSNFLGGEAPGALSAGSWRSISLDRYLQDIVGAGPNNPNGLATTVDGLQILRTLGDQETPLGLDNSADTEIDVTAAYLMAKLGGQIGDLSYWGNVGLRYVRTDQSGVGFSLVDGEYNRETAQRDYDNLLPSLNLNFNLTEDIILRFAYSETVNRPNPAGFTPGRTVVTDAGEQMNRVEIDLPSSDLEAYTADSIDLSLEWYNRKGSAITIAAYQKDVQSYFERQQICPTDGGGFGFGALFLEDLGGGNTICRIQTPFDDGSGDEPIQREIRISQVVNLDQEIQIRGIEIGVQQNLDFLDGFWSGFGGMINASFTDVSGDDADGNPLSVPRISDESYNVVAYWENEVFNARLAYNWRSEYFLVGGLSITGLEDRFVKPRGQLDFTTRYSINDNLSVNFRAFNLTEELYEEFQSGNESLNRQTAFDGRVFSVAATYRF